MREMEGGKREEEEVCWGREQDGGGPAEDQRWTGGAHLYQILSPMSGHTAQHETP